MKRGVPLKTYKPLVRKTPLRQVSAQKVAEGGSRFSTLDRKPTPRTSTPAKRPRNTNPSEATVKLVWQRDRGACVRCGVGLYPADRGDRWSVHHRVLRSHGVNNSPSNLILLCGGALAAGCHSRVHSRPAHYRREGGWILRSTDDPARYPVTHKRLGLVFLLADGNSAPSLTDGAAA